jgi:hypothetical protein
VGGQEVGQTDNYELCAAKCDIENGCQSYQWGKSLQVCTLSTENAPETNSDFGDVVFCRRLPCFNDKYKRVAGHISKWTVIYIDDKNTAIHQGVCAERCSDMTYCESFQWSPTDRRCIFSNERTDAAEQFDDYIFCSRNPT